MSTPLRAAIDKAKAEVSIGDKRLFSPELFCAAFYHSRHISLSMYEYRVELPHFHGL